MYPVPPPTGKRTLAFPYEKATMRIGTEIIPKIAPRRKTGLERAVAHPAAAPGAKEAGKPIFWRVGARPPKTPERRAQKTPSPLTSPFFSLSQNPPTYLTPPARARRTIPRIITTNPIPSLLVSLSPK